MIMCFNFMHNKVTQAMTCPNTKVQIFNLSFTLGVNLCVVHNTIATSKPYKKSYLFVCALSCAFKAFLTLVA